MNRRPQRKIHQGVVIGQISKPRVSVPTQDKKITLPRAIIAGTLPGSTRRLAEAGDAGSPVLSGSNLLMGFIVAQKGAETLVLLAHDLAKIYHLTFYSPEAPATHGHAKYTNSRL